LGRAIKALNVVRELGAFPTAGELHAETGPVVRVSKQSIGGRTRPPRPHIGPHGAGHEVAIAGDRDEQGAQKLAVLRIALEAGEARQITSCLAASLRQCPLLGALLLFIVAGGELV